MLRSAQASEVRLENLRSLMNTPSKLRIMVLANSDGSGGTADAPGSSGDLLR